MEAARKEGESVRTDPVTGDFAPVEYAAHGTMWVAVRSETWSKLWTIARSTQSLGTASPEAIAAALPALVAAAREMAVEPAGGRLFDQLRAALRAIDGK